MNLKDLAKKEKGDGVLAKYGEADDAPSFLISYMGRANIKKAKEKATEKKWDRKLHSMVEKVDDEILTMSLFSEALLGWENLKGKHLLQILDPTCIELNLTPEQMEAVIPFDADNKAVVVENYNLDFNRFITGISADVDTYRAVKEEEARGNF